MELVYKSLTTSVNNLFTDTVNILFTSHMGYSLEKVQSMDYLLKMTQREYSPAEVVEAMKEITGAQGDKELAEVLGTAKQSVHQFKKGKQQDIKMRIINYLLNERNSKKPR